MGAFISKLEFGCPTEKSNGFCVSQSLTYVGRALARDAKELVLSSSGHGSLRSALRSPFRSFFRTQRWDLRLFELDGQVRLKRAQNNADEAERCGRRTGCTHRALRAISPPRPAKTRRTVLLELPTRVWSLSTLWLHTNAGLNIRSTSLIDIPYFYFGLVI